VQSDVVIWSLGEHMSPMKSAWQPLCFCRECASRQSQRRPRQSAPPLYEHKERQVQKGQQPSWCEHTHIVHILHIAWIACRFDANGDSSARTHAHWNPPSWRNDLARSICISLNLHIITRRGLELWQRALSLSARKICQQTHKSWFAEKYDRKWHAVKST
jgi:hypothetical protein